MSETPQASWQVVETMKDFIGSIFGKRGKQPLEGVGKLPFHLYLSMGVQSFELFPAGAIDSFRFFQRVNVPADYELEFLSRLEVGDEGTENYKPYGLFRLRADEGQPILKGEDEAVVDLWRRLQEDHGLSRVPSAKTMTKGFTGFNMANDEGRVGQNQLVAPRSAKAVAKAGRKRIPYKKVLELLREAMTDQVKIAWIEDAFGDEQLVHGQIVHRYYLDAHRRCYLVRNHWYWGKQLFAPETSAEAMELCLASGLYKRPQRGRRAA